MNIIWEWIGTNHKTKFQYIPSITWMTLTWPQLWDTHKKMHNNITCNRVHLRVNHVHPHSFPHVYTKGSSPSTGLEVPSCKAMGFERNWWEEGQMWKTNLNKKTLKRRVRLVLLQYHAFPPNLQKIAHWRLILFMFQKTIEPLEWHVWKLTKIKRLQRNGTYWCFPKLCTSRNL